MTPAPKVPTPPAEVAHAPAPCLSLEERHGRQQGRDHAIREIWNRTQAHPEESFETSLQWLVAHGHVARAKVLEALQLSDKAKVAQAEGFVAQVQEILDRPADDRHIEMPLVPGAPGLPDADRSRFELLGLVGSKEAVWKREVELDRDGWGFFNARPRKGDSAAVHHFIRERDLIRERELVERVA